MSDERYESTSSGAGELIADIITAALAVALLVLVILSPGYFAEREACGSKCGDSFRFVYTLTEQSCVCVVHP